jgi:predicted transcriptional regulator
MKIRLKKQVIDILQILQEKDEKIIASELAEELNIDYIVLMAAINDLIDNKLGGFEEKEIFQVTLTEEG